MESFPSGTFLTAGSPLTADCCLGANPDIVFFFLGKMEKRAF